MQSCNNRAIFRNALWYADSKIPGMNEDASAPGQDATRRTHYERDHCSDHTGRKSYTQENDRGPGHRNG